MSLLLYVYFLSLLVAAGGIVLEERVFSPEYAVGRFYTTEGQRPPSSSQLRQLLDYCLRDQRQYTDLLLHRWEKYHGQSLLEMGRDLKGQLGFNPDQDLALANSLNGCQAPSQQDIFFNIEVVFQFGMIAYSDNYAAAKNFAFVLEYTGFFHAAKSVYRDCHLLTGDIGCLLHHAMTVPILPYSQAQTELVYLEMLRSFFQFLMQVKPEADQSQLPQDFIYNTLREVSINTHYLGFSPGRIFHLFSESIQKYYPSIVQLRVDLKHHQNKLMHVLRVGIVSEYHGNSSPGLCMHEILFRLQTLFPQIQLVFFDRPTLGTVFGEMMRTVAKETYMLNEHDVKSSRDIIADAQVDVLLYLAVPTGKFTYILSFSRLAPVQIQLGLGHPLSSGVVSMDYSVVATSMLSPIGAQTKADHTATALRCGIQAYLCDDEVIHSYSQHLLNLDQHGNLTGSIPHRSVLQECELAEECYRRDAPDYYSEQVVQFDGMGHYIPDTIHFYHATALYELLLRATLYRSGPIMTGDNNHLEEEKKMVNYNMACETINEQLRIAGIYPHMSAEGIGCQDARGTIHPRQYHVYHMLQYMKKFHPMNDEIILGIISKDATARFLVPAAATVLLPRLLRMQRDVFHTTMSTEELLKHFVLVPKVEHPLYLMLLGLSSVFINTVPYGAGMTSSEALAMCTPVIVIPQETSVLNFAWSQLRTMGEDVEALLTAKSLTDFAQLAVDLVHGHKVMGLNAVKNLMCERKKTLFDEHVITQSTEEWGKFLLRVSPP